MAAGLVGLMLQVACGPDPTAMPTALPTATVPPMATPTAVAGATPTPVLPPEGTLRVAVTGAADHRDLHRLVSEWATLFGPSLSYNRLLRFATGPGVPLPSLVVECDLCSEWRQVDQITYEMDVHPDARWQDTDGLPSRPVTTDDVVFSLERLRTRGYPHVALLDSVDRILAPTERTVQLRLHFPDPDLPIKLASPYAVMVRPEVMEAEDPRTAPVVGSGPWRYQQGLSGQVKLTAWEEYWRPGQPMVQAIVFQPAASLDVGVGVLRGGRADMAQVTEEQWAALAQEGFSSAVVQRQGRGLLFGLNTARAPFADVLVRRAALKALDPHGALANTFGIGSVGVGVPVVAPQWLVDDATLRATFDEPGAARELLREANAEGTEFALVVANFGEEYVAHGTALADQLRGVGFDVTVDVLSRGAYLSRVWRDRDFDAFVGPLPPIDTPNGFLLALLHSRGSSNVTGMSDEAIDALIEAQAIESDIARRGELVRKLQVRTLAGAWLFMPVISAERWAYTGRVRDLAPAMPMGAGDLWRAVGIEEQP